MDDSPDYQAQHHMLRNQVTHKIKKAKAQFIKTSIVENKGNPTQLWRVLQDLGCSKKCKTSFRSEHFQIVFYHYFLSSLSCSSTDQALLQLWKCNINPIPIKYRLISHTCLR